MNTIEEIKRRLIDAVDSLKPMVEDVARSLYEHPELGLQEEFASSKLTDILKAQGFEVERGTGGLPTAFTGKVGNKKPTIAFLAEYDALPGIGHGCGHNLMAACALAAGITAKTVLPPKSTEVTWMVIGTPAEETVGGKVQMAERGVFDSVDAAFIAHPGQRNSLGGSSFASHPLEMTFYGRPSHAGGNPQGGINALDALVDAYVAIRMMKNQLRDDVRLAGIITMGGDAPNIIPEKAQARFTLRSKDSRYLEEVVIPRVKQCAQGAAISGNAKVEFRHYEPFFRETLEHPILKQLAEKNFEYLGIEVPPPEEGLGGGVTDVGSVTWVTPCIQIGFSMTDARGHSREMADSTVTERATEATLTAAKVLLLSAADLLFNPHLLREARAHLDHIRKPVETGK